MLFLQDELRKEKSKEKGQKGGISKEDLSEKLKKENLNNDFMYINYEI